MPNPNDGSTEYETARFTKRPTAALTGREPPSPVRGRGELTVERTVRLGLDAEALWDAVASPAGWATWLVDAARFDDDMANCPSGVVVDGDTVREVRVDRIEPGRMLGYTWWDRQDPMMTSYVTVEITSPDGGESVLSIREVLCAPDAAVSAEASSRIAEARLAWEVRVCVLWACTVAAALV